MKLQFSQQIFEKNIQLSNLMNKTTRYFCQTLMKLEFSQQIFEKNIQLSNLMKIRPVIAGMFDVGRTDRHDDATVAFHNSAKALKKSGRNA